MCRGPAILKANRQRRIAGTGRDYRLLKGRMRIALDGCKEPRAERCTPSSGQQRFADALPIADSARSDHRYLFSLLQHERQRLVQASGGLQMPTGFRALADQIIRASVQRGTSTLRTRD